jgi:hypothetical protein
MSHGSSWPLPAGWPSAAYEGAAAGFGRRAISLADPVRTMTVSGTLPQPIWASLNNIGLGLPLGN